MRVQIQIADCTADMESKVLFLSDEGPTLKTLDFAFYIGSIHKLFIFRFV